MKKLLFCIALSLFITGCSEEVGTKTELTEGYSMEYNPNNPPLDGPADPIEDEDWIYTQEKEFYALVSPQGKEVFKECIRYYTTVTSFSDFELFIKNKKESDSFKALNEDEQKYITLMLQRASYLFSLLEPQWW